MTVGVFSLSVFWGVALGVFAAGSLAFGWWAVGCAAAGVRGAVGFAAIARDYAIGIAAEAAETGPAAKAWLQHQWGPEFVDLFVPYAPWWIAGSSSLRSVCAGGAWEIRNPR